ncbi:hypothetical protein MPH_04773 [Macrophomina phaseolina MS6]|uniref:Uncharacterized protein n=1 Tax=Macrophomina phaseolina (strain MS6) TaxID=1126212 RepID=K2RTL4_MACPH|nr:hypothetical protein MPH_04773 [Macrophomina phaseolina MS6]
MPVHSPNGSLDYKITAACNTPAESITEHLEQTTHREDTEPHNSILKSWKSHIKSFLAQAQRVLYRCKSSARTPVVRRPDGDDKELDVEDFIRDIELLVKHKRPDGTRDETAALLPAFFDFGFHEGTDASSCILLNRSELHDMELPDGLLTPYKDPENPPVRIRNLDGTFVKLYGEFPAKWAIRGTAKKYRNQKLFPTGQKFIRSRCLLIGEESPFSCLIGWNTIHVNQLDQEHIAAAAGKGNRAMTSKNDGKHSNL